MGRHYVNIYTYFYLFVCFWVPLALNIYNGIGMCILDVWIQM